MTAFTSKFAKIMAQANVVIKHTEKRSVEFTQATVQKCKYK